MLLMWFSPSIPILLLGGFAIAPAISLSVRAHYRFMPRGWVILASFLVLVGVATLALVGLVPILISQLVSFISYVPEYAIGAEHLLCGLLEPLAQRGLLPGTPEEYITNLGQDLLNLAQSIAQQILGGLLDFISGTFNLILTLLGVLFVAVYLLINVRNIKVSYLRVRPRHYRTDVRDLWDAFAFSLSRYLSALGLRTTHHSAARGPRVPPGPAARGRQRPDAPITGTDPAGTLYPDLPGHHRWWEIVSLLGVISAVPTVAVLRALFDFLRVRPYTRSQ
jgi:predicted PurR-regulated permease PerM